MGWSIKDAAETVGVDPGTWAGWEQGNVVLHRRHRTLIARLLELCLNALNQEMTAQWKQMHGGES
jgi:transcriptional regulator with XRE-family HTH domain